MDAHGQQQRRCEMCGKRPATIELTEFVDGKPVEKHLCEECYNKQEGVPPLSPSKVINQLIGIVAPELQKLATRQCPECGMNYLEFRQTLNLGCPHDYEVFAPALDELLQRIHGANRHVGKVPVGAAQRGVPGVRLEVLRRELKRAVDAEDYERAAQLRDQIRALERTVATDPEG